MTETEWLTCQDPTLMLEFLQEGGKATERKLRLFAVARCRLVWHLLADERSRAAVEVAEQFADGLLTRQEADAAFTEACAASLEALRSPDKWSETVLRFRRQRDPDKLRRAAFIAAFAVGNGVGAVESHIRGGEVKLVDGLTRSRLLRDVFGIPFRTFPIDPLWLTWNGSTVAKLAQAIYDERRFTDLPILADALEEAGCDNADILAHRRSGGEHVRGCWVVDALLGKE
jgi:hypothetical protein